MSECVEWGGELRSGYGVIYLGQKNGRSERIYAHRAFYLIYNGPIPPGYIVHHECRNPLCVNPRHLRAMSRKEHTAEHEWESIRKAIAARVANGRRRRDERLAAEA